MTTPAQKRKWLRVGIMMAAGLIIGMTGVIKEADIPDLWLGVICTIGFGSFLLGLGILINGTTNR